ncbi:TfoX/Sxy family protein [Aeromicrobium sp. YIM 150415]|uniref:TfoX/Sxy family protein n=1 Tax=Aeromicrobium sp. YIM 150415 TaxID=2803912 RepID=UPI001964C04E|nr:TfoX/Sxy family protein [Aeromicrobium sp. YIM 150415]MBM9463120.1 TfoX/Sxy family protein [Aeromicrobium sp. YIM 150415]
MAYDLELADRLRDLLIAEPDLTEKRMFGGLAFLVGGAMAVAATDDGLLLRVDPEERDELATDPLAGPWIMRGSELRGWLRIEADASTAAETLEPWLERAVRAARASR